MPLHFLITVVRRFFAGLARGRELLGTGLAQFLNFFTPRRTLQLGSALSVAFVMVVLLAARAEAQTATAISNAVTGAANAGFTVIFGILNTILVVIVQTVGQIASLIISILVAVSQYNTFSTVKVVDVGWTIVKDVSNMLFIIALLVIAAGTVLRLENYRYNRLLSNLIIMAFLTNSSKFIAAFFIQGAQVLMLTFVNAYRDALYGNFVSLFGLENVLRFNPLTSGSGMDSAAVFANMLGSLIIVVIAVIVTAAILVVIVVRIVALWILVILSPLAFATQILPTTKSFATKWWSEFGKYVTQGPILAFFLWLALAIVNVGGGVNSIDPNLGKIATDLETNRAGANFFNTAAFTFDNLITFIISTAFLMFGLQYATSSSGVAGKWAGKVAAGTTTALGINAIRDRTVAPVQGWIKNRGAARQAAIQERTQTLEAAGDRLRSRLPVATIPGTNIGLSRAGAEKARASANAYERQRTQRFTQSRGLGDETEQQLQTRMQNSTDRRERLAALTQLQERGRLNLRDPSQDAAFTQIMAQNRIPPADARKLRQQALSTNVGAMEEADVRARLVATADTDEQVILAKELDRRKALNPEDAADVGIVNQLRANLNGIPQQLKEFDDALKRSNPRMAMEAIYNSFRNGAQDVDRLLSDIQQGTFSATNLRSRDYAGMVQSMQNQNGMSLNQAQSHIANNVLGNARTRQELESTLSSLPSDVRHRMFNNVEIDELTSREKRDSLALQGYADEAYRNITARLEPRTSLPQLYSNYVGNNEARVASLMKEGRLSKASILNGSIMTEMLDSRRIGRSVLSEAAKNNPELRDDIRTSIGNVVYATNTAVDAGGNPTAVADNSEQGRRENARREAYLDLAEGGKVANPVNGRQESVFDVAYGSLPQAEQANARAARRNAVQKVGESLTKMNMADLTNVNVTSDQSRRDIVLNISPTALYKISEKNPDVARGLADAKRNSDPVPAGSPFLGETLEAAEKEMLIRHLRSLNSRNDRGI